MSALFRSEDYPARPLRRRIEGTVGFRLEIDSAGGLTSCQIAQTSGNPDLDRATCEIVRERARFTPARDLEGRPLPDTLTARITWRLGEEEEFWRFARDQIVTTVTWADPDPVCTETWNGQPMGEMSASECLERFAPAMQMVRDMQGAFELTFVDAMTPEGTDMERSQVAGLGQPVAIQEAELEIEPSGRIAGCRVIRSEVYPTEATPPEGEMDSICVGYQGGATRFEPAAASGGVRRVRVFGGMYLRHRSAG